MKSPMDLPMFLGPSHPKGDRSSGCHLPSDVGKQLNSTHVTVVLEALSSWANCLEPGCQVRDCWMATEDGNLVRHGMAWYAHIIYIYATFACMSDIYIYVYLYVN